MAPADTIDCQPHRCTLMARACATRHVLRLPSGAGRGFPRFPFCAACPLGAIVLARLEAAGWARPPDTIPAEVLSPAQARARRRWRLSFPADSEPRESRSDPVRELGASTPDDRCAGVDAG